MAQRQNVKRNSDYVFGSAVRKTAPARRDRRQELRDRCFETMCARVKDRSKYAYWTYVQRDGETEEKETETEETA